MTLPAPYPGVPPLKKRTRTDTIVVHCADTPASMDVNARMINQWHVKDNGWSAIGYHYVIKRDGTIEGGRPHDTQGAHVASINDRSVGICLAGGKGPYAGLDWAKLFTKEQMLSLVVVIKTLQEIYPGTTVAGHRDFDKGKQCPSFDAKTWWSTGPGNPAGYP